MAAGTYGDSWLRRPYRDSDYTHGFQAYVCLFQPRDLTLDNVGAVNKRRNEFMDLLQKKGVATRPGTHAVHMLQYYSSKYDIRPEDYPAAYLADQCSIAFPLFPSMTAEEFDYVIQAIGECHGNMR